MTPGAPSGSLRRRSAALAALVLVPAGAVAIIVAMLRGLPGLLVALALLAAAVYLAWKALVRRGLRRRVYATLAALLFVAAVVAAVVVGVQLPLLALGTGLVAVGSVLAGVALSWMHRPDGRLVGRARHPVLIVNPRSGDGAAAKSGVIDEARRRGVRVIELTGEGGENLEAVARRALRRGADCIGMAGGDGSLACVAEAAMAAHVPFVCVPSGTRNHFALDVGLDRSDPVAALDAFGEAFQRRIDVGRVNGRTFVNNVSIGVYGEVVADEQYRENKVGTALQRIPDLIGPESEPLDLRFDDGEGTPRESAVVLHVSNNVYTFGPVSGFASRPSLTDGMLGVVAVTAPQGAGRDRVEVLQWQAPTFTVASSGPVASGIDGEAVELSAPVRFEIVPDALSIRLPRDAAGVPPGARRPPLTLETARRLAAVAFGRTPAELH